MAALCASIACLSTDSSSIKAVPFFQGSLDIIENGVTSKLYYYAGIARMVIRGCEDGESCPPESIGWGSDACDLYFTNCHKCIFKPRKVSFPLVMSLLGQVGQIGTDLTRSTGIHTILCRYLTINTNGKRLTVIHAIAQLCLYRQNRRQLPEIVSAPHT